MLQCCEQTSQRLTDKSTKPPCVAKPSESSYHSRYHMVQTLWPLETRSFTPDVIQTARMSAEMLWYPQSAPCLAVAFRNRSPQPQHTLHPHCRENWTHLQNLTQLIVSVSVTSLSFEQYQIHKSHG